MRKLLEMIFGIQHPDKRKNSPVGRIERAEFVMGDALYTPLRMLYSFMKYEAAGGIVLLICAAAALIFANTMLRGWYEDVFHHTTAVIGIGSFEIEKHLVHWINDGLMAVFFFLIGLEIKREMLEGMLSSWSQRVLPGLAAVGGMAVPAVFYIATGHLANAPADVMHGWAIPTATDIAFAIGIFALMGRHLPISLKVFLLALAILDDLGAIVIIALFYTGDLNTTNLLWAGVFLSGLFVLNRLKVSSLSWYILLGVAMWACVLKSGVHATLAGVLLAFMIPMNTIGERRSLVRQLEHDLQPFVAFFVIPMFAFANAGVYLKDVTWHEFFSPITLGIMLGLFFGKQIGIFGSVWLLVKTGAAKMPRGATWLQVWGVSCLAGIGFTMSLFIGTLAFTGENALLYNVETKLGILAGSTASGILGLTVLWLSTLKSRREKKENRQPA